MFQFSVIVPFLLRGQACKSLRPWPGLSLAAVVPAKPSRFNWRRNVSGELKHWL